MELTSALSGLSPQKISLKKFLIFFPKKPALKIFIVFSQKTLFLHFGKRNFLIFSQKSFSYISGNGIF